MPNIKGLGRRQKEEEEEEEQGRAKHFVSYMFDQAGDNIDVCLS